MRLRVREAEEDVQKQKINGQRGKKKDHSLSLLMPLRPVRRQTASEMRGKEREKERREEKRGGEREGHREVWR